MGPQSLMQVSEVDTVEEVSADSRQEGGLDVSASELQQKSSTRNPRRKRGDLDDDVWYGISIAHASLWGMSTLLFVVSYFGAFKSFKVSFIEHVISNLNWMVYLGTIVALTIDGAQANDSQSYYEMAVYAMIFGGGAFTLELINGMGAIKYLDPDYPYDDLVLLPSIFYTLGFAEHTWAFPAHGKGGQPIQISDDIQSSPSQEDDEVILDDFHVAAL